MDKFLRFLRGLFYRRWSSLTYENHKRAGMDSSRVYKHYRKRLIFSKLARCKGVERVE